MAAPSLAKPNHSAALVGWDDAAQDFRFVAVDANGYVQTGATVQTGDIEIGAVELKNDVDDTRAKVGPGSATNALRVTESRSSTLSDAADVTLTNGIATQIVASDSTAKTRILRASSSNTTTVRIGTQANVGASRGHPLLPGEGVMLDTTAAIYGYAGSASQVVSVLVVGD